MMIGTLEDARRSRASSKPVSPGIMTSRIKQIEAQPFELGAGVGGGLRGGDAVALGEQEARQQIANAAVVVDHQQMGSIVGKRGGDRAHGPAYPWLALSRAAAAPGRRAQ